MLHLCHEAFFGGVVCQNGAQALDLVIAQVTLIDELSRAFGRHIKHLEFG